MYALSTNILSIESQLDLSENLKSVFNNGHDRTRRTSGRGTALLKPKNLRPCDKWKMHFVRNSRFRPLGQLLLGFSLFVLMVDKRLLGKLTSIFTFRHQQLIFGHVDVRKSFVNFQNDVEKLFSFKFETSNT